MGWGGGVGGGEGGGGEVGGGGVGGGEVGGGEVSAVLVGSDWKVVVDGSWDGETGGGVGAVVDWRSEGLVLGVLGVLVVPWVPCLLPPSG